MNLSAVPYLLVSRELELPLGNERVFVCLCLIDHMVIGVGPDRDGAMRAMVDELERKYGAKWDPRDDLDDDSDVDEISLN